MREALALDPSAEPAARDLAAALSELSLAIRSQGDLAAADAPAEEALAISRRLATAAPNSVRAQGDLVSALRQCGDLRLAQQDTTGATAAFAEALGVARAMARSRPTAIFLARSINELMAKLADIPGSGVTWAQVIANLEDMRARGVFEANDETTLELYQMRAASEFPTPR